VAGVLACFLVIDVNPAQQGFESRFGVARQAGDHLIEFMKEPSSAQATYDGSLKELAGVHVGLVSSVLFLFILPLPMYLVGVMLKMNGTLPDQPYRAVLAGIFLLACAIGYASILYNCIRLARLLFPFIWFTLSGVALVPITTIPMAIIFWVCAIRQLRARGLQVGIFGINPAKVES